jgi:hypothetical protein
LLLSLDLFNLLDLAGYFRGILPFFDQRLISATFSSPIIASFLFDSFLLHPLPFLLRFLREFHRKPIPFNLNKP